MNEIDSDETLVDHLRGVHQMEESNLAGFRFWIRKIGLLKQSGLGRNEISWQTAVGGLDLRRPIRRNSDFRNEKWKSTWRSNKPDQSERRFRFNYWRKKSKLKTRTTSINQSGERLRSLAMSSPSSLILTVQCQRRKLKGFRRESNESCMESSFHSIKPLMVLKPLRVQ